MDESTLLQHLEALNFSKIQAQVYITLVKYSKLNGSQIAKMLNVSRSSVYSALNDLYNKGYVFLLPGESNEYAAQDPEVLLTQLAREYAQAADLVKEELARFKTDESPQEYYNIKGFQNFVLKTKELLSQAEKEVYMNTCFEPRMFAEELQTLAKRGVRVIVFTFSDVDPAGLPIEFYRRTLREDCGGGHLRMMLVIDMKTALIAGSYRGGDVTGTFTENRLLVDIVSEHIHLDIYLLKLQKKFGESGFLDGVTIHSMQEEHQETNRCATA